MTTLLLTRLWYEQLGLVVLSHSQTVNFPCHVAILGTKKALLCISNTSNMRNLKTLRVLQKEHIRILINRLTFSFACKVAVKQGNNQLYFLSRQLTRGANRLGNR